MTKKIEAVPCHVERLQQQAIQIGNDVIKYQEHTSAITFFIRNITNRGDVFFISSDV